MEYTVSIDNFNGPMDLLLYLIKQEEMEIHEIPISTICSRYLDYIKALEFLDVDITSEFLVMAATLMLIKSRSLLPKEDAVDIEEELDPEDELIQQLLEYKQYKVASRDLSEMAELRSRVFPFDPPKPDKGEQEIELEDIDLWDLVKAFGNLMQETGLHKLPKALKDEKSLRAYIGEVFEIVRSQGKVQFRALFDGAASRVTIVGRFIALLELVRRKKVGISQERFEDQIEIEIQDDRDLSAEEIDVMEADMEAEVDAVEDDLPGAEARDGSSMAEGLPAEGGQPTTDQPTSDQAAEPTSSVQDGSDPSSGGTQQHQDSGTKTRQAENQAENRALENG